MSPYCIFSVNCVLYAMCSFSTLMLLSVVAVLWSFDL